MEAEHKKQRAEMATERKELREEVSAIARSIRQQGR